MINRLFFSPKSVTYVAIMPFLQPLSHYDVLLGIHICSLESRRWLNLVLYNRINGQSRHSSSQAPVFPFRVDSPERRYSFSIWATIIAKRFFLYFLREFSCLSVYQSEIAPSVPTLNAPWSAIMELSVCTWSPPQCPICTPQGKRRVRTPTHSKAVSLSGAPTPIHHIKPMELSEKKSRLTKRSTFAIFHCRSAHCWSFWCSYLLIPF